MPSLSRPAGGAILRGNTRDHVPDRTGSERAVREEIDPPELFRHPAYKRVVTVSGDMKLVFIAGQTPSDENYRCVAPGDYKAQWLKVMENLDVQLRAAGATWDDVVFRRIFV